MTDRLVERPVQCRRVSFGNRLLDGARSSSASDLLLPAAHRALGDGPCARTDRRSWRTLHRPWLGSRQLASLSLEKGNSEKENY